MLLTRHDLKISRETLRKWMMGDGLWLSPDNAGAFISLGCAVKHSES
jgi:hypothetical protein